MQLHMGTAADGNHPTSLVSVHRGIGWVCVHWMGVCALDGCVCIGWVYLGDIGWMCVEGIGWVCIGGIGMVYKEALDGCT